MAEQVPYEELRRLAQEALQRSVQATEGPWTAWLYLNGQWGIKEFRELERSGEQIQADAEFAAAAREDVPALATAVLWLLDRLERVEEE